MKKINEYVFYPLQRTARRSSWQYAKEVTDLQCNSDLKEKYSNVGPFGLHSKCTDTNSFPEFFF